MEAAATELQTLWSQLGSVLHRKLGSAEGPVRPRPLLQTERGLSRPSGRQPCNTGARGAASHLPAHSHSVPAAPSTRYSCRPHTVYRAHHTYVHTPHADTVHTLCIYHMPSTTIHTRHAHAHILGTHTTHTHTRYMHHVSHIDTDVVRTVYTWCMQHTLDITHTITMSCAHTVHLIHIYKLCMLLTMYNFIHTHHACHTYLE